MEKLSKKQIELIDKYWRAANYLSVGQIYLQDNPLLREPLKPDHIKPRLLGHFGTVPGLNLIYIHLNRMIRYRDCDVIYVTGPGHGGPALFANTYLEGTLSEVYPDITRDEAGMLTLFRKFSWPGGLPSHCGPQTPGSINEGGELGYSLARANGAVMDNPELLAVCVVGDGEAETGALAASWQSNKFINPVRDGAVLPILHLNCYKISGPTVLGRSTDKELKALFSGLGYAVRFVAGDDPLKVHRAFANALNRSYLDIRKIQMDARMRGFSRRHNWPMIILRTPKGWTGPKVVDGKQVEGTFRSHQVPVAKVKENREHLKILEEWMKSYRPEELFDEDGRLIPELANLAPYGNKRMGASPYANGGKLLKPLITPDIRDYAVVVREPGTEKAEATRELGKFLRDIFRNNAEESNFRLFCPDETSSNRLDAVFEVTNRCSVERIIETDDHIAPDGRVLEILSEHMCQGWLEGYLLTGRHGIFPCYEAFATIVDSMMNQYAKWLKMSAELPWRAPVASLNYLLTSHAWRQDHNGYSHQGPGFIDSVMTKKGSVVRIYLPPDANSLISMADHCLKSKGYINVIVAGKQPALQWMDMDTAVEHCMRGASVWEWASSDGGKEPDVVLGCAGDVPTLETVAAAWLLRKHLPALKVRVVNVTDLMTLHHHSHHPHGFDEETFRELFTDTAPVVFAFHGYPRVIHVLAYKRPNAERFHVRGYVEEGTTTTPFDMVVCNGMSRYHLAIEALHRAGRLQSESGDIIEYFKRKLEEHSQYVRAHGEDMPEIRDWVWTSDPR